MSGWRSFKSAPKDGTAFLALHGPEVFVARYFSEGRKRPELAYRTHSLFVPEHHRIIDAEMDGANVKAYVPVGQPWKETFRHEWTFWQRGFDFKPTKWAPIPMPKRKRKASR